MVGVAIWTVVIHTLYVNRRGLSTTPKQAFFDEFDIHIC